jgi:hypothetical protein
MRAGRSIKPGVRAAKRDASRGGEGKNGGPAANNETTRVCMIGTRSTTLKE